MGFLYNSLFLQIWGLVFVNKAQLRGKECLWLNQRKLPYGQGIGNADIWEGRSQVEEGVSKKLEWEQA